MNNWGTMLVSFGGVYGVKQLRRVHMGSVSIGWRSKQPWVLYAFVLKLYRISHVMRFQSGFKSVNTQRNPHASLFPLNHFDIFPLLRRYSAYLPSNAAP